MIEILKEYLQTKNMSFSNAVYEEDYDSKFISYLFKFYLNFGMLVV